MIHRLLLLAGVLLLNALPACTSQSAIGQGGQKNDLSAMKTDTIRIGQHEFRTWLALDADEQMTGLMNTTEEEIAPGDDGMDRGMLFVFSDDQRRGFWMRNTIIPLDIAYIRSDGKIVKIYTMTPLTQRIYSSVEPAQFALEVQAGRFSELGIIEGDVVEIPESVLKAIPN